MRRTRRLDRARLLWCVPLASTLLACSAQVESDYPGEPLATLHGSVTARASALEGVPDVSAGIMWTTIDPRFIGERVEVDGSFPATFTLDLFAPPPPEAEIKTSDDYCVDGERLNTLSSPEDDCSGRVIPAGTPMGFWIGYIVAVDSDVTEGEVARPEVAGADVDHMIVYFEHDDPSKVPLPANPSDEQLAQHLPLAEPDYVGSHDAGYHLGKFNPEHRAQRQEWHECTWEGLCVHWTTKPKDQSLADHDFERCTERFPENPTCSAFASNLTDGEPASSTACREQYLSLEHVCHGAVSEPSVIENPDDLDDPVTIQLGLRFWDVADWNVAG